MFLTLVPSGMFWCYHNNAK